jgi:F-type H+-transporting ATPase subunit delta
MATTSLRGPSAEAARRLESRLAEAIESVGSRKTAEIGQDLFGLADVVRREPRLRRVVTDVALDDSVKAGLVRSLFGDKAAEESVELLVLAAAQRWTSPRDLADTLEVLGVETTVRSADDPGRVADELFTLSRLLEDSPELRNALGDPGRSTEDKRSLLRGLLENRTLVSTLRLVEQAVAGTHRTIALAVEEYQKVAAAVQDERVATVRSARPLSDSDQDRLRTALKRQYDRDIHLNLVVEPELIGGMRVEIGDDVIDGTVASRLDDARRRLAG